jgi:hypothetical protein
MRVSLHAQRKPPSSETNANHQNGSNRSSSSCVDQGSDHDETAIEASQQASQVDDTILRANSHAGRNLIRTLLKQVRQSYQCIHERFTSFSMQAAFFLDSGKREGTS